MALLTVALVTLVHPQPPARAAFPGANGKIAFVSDRDGNSDIYVMNADGGAEAPVTPDAPPVGFGTIEGSPAWSPDGSRIAFVSDRVYGYEVFTMRADGSGLAITGVQFADYPSWSPDGSRIVLSSRYLEQTVGSSDLFIIDVRTGTQTRIKTSEDEVQPAWSPDGSLIAFASGGEIYVSDEHGGGRTNLTNDPAADWNPDWSPDGSKIAFVSDRDGDFNVYVMDRDGRNVIKLTQDTSFDGDPSWSPDGSRIAFTSERDGNPEVYVMNADGSDQTRLTDNSASDWYPAWQPLLAGDANCGDGVNSIDAVLILQFDAGLLHSVACRDLADVNHDGRVDSRDAALILQYSAGLFDSFLA